jgi:DNA-binding transcriptional LysR family regulator
MELRHLRYFVCVAEELHFGRAAVRLGVSQPPLSQQIRALEDELGVKLLERSSRKVALTEPGRLFLEEARTALAQADHAIQVARRAGRGDFGTLAIGFNPSAPFVPLVANALFDFRQLHPDVRIELLELSAGAQVDALLRGEIDIGFLRGSLPPELPDALSATWILDERLHVAMRPDHRLAKKRTLAFRDLDGEAMIFYARQRKGSFAGQVLEMLYDIGVEPKSVQDVREVTTLFSLIAAGFGITVLAESLCALQPVKVTYRPLQGKGSMSPLWILSRKSISAQAARQFLEVIKLASPLEARSSG